MTVLEIKDELSFGNAVDLQLKRSDYPRKGQKQRSIVGQNMRRTTLPECTTPRSALPIDQLA